MNRLLTWLEKNIRGYAGERNVTARWKFAGVRSIGPLSLTSI
jgi:hypothetical protein